MTSYGQAEDPGDTLGTPRRPQCHLEDHGDTPGVVGGPPVTSWRTQVTLLEWLEDPGDTLGTTRRPQCHLEDHSDILEDPSDTPGVVGGALVTPWGPLEDPNVTWRTMVALLEWLEDPR